MWYFKWRWLISGINLLPEQYIKDMTLPSDVLCLLGYIKMMMNDMGGKYWYIFSLYEMSSTTTFWHKATVQDRVNIK